MYKALNAINKKSGADTSFVITDENNFFNGATKDGVLYIGKDQFENGRWAETFVHEVAHLEEGTKEYNKLCKYLQSDDILVDDGTGAKITLRDKAFNRLISKGYDIDYDTVENISEKLNKNLKLTTEEKRIYNDFATELMAHQAELLLGDENFINKIIQSDVGLVEKIIDRLADIKNALQNADSAGTKAQRSQIRKAGKLYLKAAENINDARLARYITSRLLDEEEQLEMENSETTAEKGNENSLESIDEETKIRYNLRSKYNFSFLHKNFPSETETQSEAHRLAVWWARRTDVITGDQTLISMNDKWYLVEKFDDALNNYQVEEFVPKTEFKKIFEETKLYGRSGKSGSLSRGIDRSDMFYQRSSSDIDGESSANGFKIGYNQEKTIVQRLVENEVGWGKRSERDGGGNSESRSSNRQGTDTSVKNNFRKSLKPFNAQEVAEKGAPRTPGQADISKGELQKLRANTSREKVYSKTEALEVLRKISGIDNLKQKDIDAIADGVWQMLNESPEGEERETIANDMAEYIVSKIFLEAKTENDTWERQDAREQLAYLRSGIGKIEFYPEDLSELRHLVDKSGVKELVGRWGYDGNAYLRNRKKKAYNFNNKMLICMLFCV